MIQSDFAVVLEQMSKLDYDDRCSGDAIYYFRACAAHFGKILPKFDHYGFDITAYCHPHHLGGFELKLLWKGSVMWEFGDFFDTWPHWCQWDHTYREGKFWKAREELLWLLAAVEQGFLQEK